MMSVKVMTHIWEKSKTKGAKLLMLLAIADNANDDGYAFPSVPTLAKKTRTTIRSAQRMIDTLELSGDIVVFNRVDPERPEHHYSNVYLIPLPGKTEVTVDVKGELRRRVVTPTSLGSDTHVIGVVTPTSSEPSLEPSVEPEEGETTPTPQIENGGAKAEPLPTATRIVTPELAAAGGLDLKVAAALGLLNPDPPIKSVPDLSAVYQHPAYKGWQRAWRESEYDEPTTLDPHGKLAARLKTMDYTEDDGYLTTQAKIKAGKVDIRFEWVLDDIPAQRNKRKFDAAAAADAHLQKFVSTSAATNTRADDYFDPTKFKKPEVTP